MSRRTCLALLLAAILAGPPPVTAQQDTTDYPPAGFGTLRQDAISIGLRTTEFEIQVIPLDERVIRLLSPDTYRSLYRLKNARSADLERSVSQYGLQDPSLFLVRFFGLQQSVRFEPELLTVTSQNRLFRVLEILPMSPQWNRRQVNQRETATAIYVFGDGIRPLDPLRVSYGTATTDAWAATLRNLERERASVIARAGGERR